MLQMCTYGEGATRHYPGGMVLSEYASQYAVWAIMGSPLIHSADFRTVGQRHPECLKLMLNRRILAVNQDPAAHPTKLMRQLTNHSTVVNSSTIVEQVFVRPLGPTPEKRVAVVLFNRREAAADINVSFAEVGLQVTAGKPVRVEDAMTGTDSMSAGAGYGVRVDRHSAAFVVLQA